MKKIISWLGQNKVIATMAGLALYLGIVTFHDEITVVAIKWRNSAGLQNYNAWLARIFLAIFIMALLLFTYHILKGKQKMLKTIMVVIMAVLTLLSFRYLMTYNIEAIHFVEYMLVAMIMLPVFRSYGETVFWVTIAGILDETYQYLVLTPNFDYFDFNDIILNLVGATTGVILVFVAAGSVIEIKRRRILISPGLITAITLLAVFIILALSGKLAFDPTETSGMGAWFSLNREIMPDAFWIEAYAGRKFHVLSAWEGISLLYFFFTVFYLLDTYFMKMPFRQNT